MFKKGDRIGPYELLEEVGKGQFGVVWRASKQNAFVANLQVALKLPHDEEVEMNILRQEAETWVAAGGHINILPILDADIYQGQVVFASEFMPDGSLAGWIKRHGGCAPSVQAALEMMLGILAGLEHLHTRRPKPIIHRDLKPANILLQGSVPRLADFGLARVLKSMDQSQGVGGSPYYMPPEAFKSVRSQQTDIWSAGVILHEMLSGRLPFQQRDLPSLLNAIINSEPEPLPSAVPAPVRNIVARALQKEPQRRFQTASEMRLALLAAQKALNAPPPSEIRNQPTVIQGSSELPGTIVQPRPPFQPSRPVQPVYHPAPQPTPAPDQYSVQAHFQPSYQPTPVHNPSHSESTQRNGSKPWRLNTTTTLLLLLGVIALSVLITLLVRNLMSGEKSGAASAAANGSAQENKTAQPYTETLPGGVKLEMIPLPPGSFMMGSPTTEKGSDADEGPQHRVTINDQLFIGKYEVTQAQWQAIMGMNPSEFKGDNRPVDNISWDDAKEFCQRLTKATGRTYRLPSEAEWEYACRAGTTTAFAFGDSLGSDQANFDGNYPYGGAPRGTYREETTSVGSFRPNAFGLYDMHGNVLEWCEDIGHSSYQGAPTDGSSWVSDGQFSKRVLRGGSYIQDGLSCRSANRLTYDPSAHAANSGLRVVSVAGK